MARIELDPNYTTPTFSRATAPTDIFKDEDVQMLAAAVSTHVHDGAGKGLAVTSISVPAGSIPGTAIATGGITSTQIADGGIQTVDLADGSVTTPKIASGVTISAPVLNSATINTPTIVNPTINGTISGGPLFASGPTTNDWFRVSTINMGILNLASNNGIQFDATGPMAYNCLGGTHLITETGTQTLTNKTITAPTLGGVIAGTPTYASPQTFPSLSKVGGYNALALQANANDWILDMGSTAALSVPGAGLSNQAVTFNHPFTAPPFVLLSLQFFSGTVATLQDVQVMGHNVTTTGFQIDAANSSGGTQTVIASWIAIGH